MPADRYDTNEPYLGPSGGCAMITRECLTTLKKIAGYFFDGRYFCYCEDTDLAFRAILHGYRPAFVNEVLALHQGQASSGKGFNFFIAYHGLRNITWMALKLAPTSILIRFGLHFFCAHILWSLNQIALGRFRLFFQTYTDILRKTPSMLSERTYFNSSIFEKKKGLNQIFSKRFYRKGYFTSSARNSILSLLQSLREALRSKR